MLIKKLQAQGYPPRRPGQPPQPGTQEFAYAQAQANAPKGVKLPAPKPAKPKKKPPPGAGVVQLSI